jgi:kynurenine 3-monooxygenase
LIETDIYPWAIGSTCLIGDSAHAYQPFYGLGYNTTLEDIMCLDHFLDKYDNDFQKAFSSMQQIQYPNAKAAG